MKKPTHAIIRRFRDSKKAQFVKWCYSLKEAQQYCSRDDTHGKDWFDGYSDNVAEWEGKPILTFKTLQNNSLTQALFHVYR
jgi:hypothetical protein